MYDFLFVITELFSLALTIYSYRRGATRQNESRLCYQAGVGHLEPRFQGEGVVPGEYFLVSTKLDTFCYLSANCTVLRAVVLTQYRRVTDGQTDKRNCCS